MVNNHALILVPISKLVCLAQAFITVSCTRSSALSCFPVSETANARRLGSVASISRLKDVGSAVMPLLSVSGCACRFLLLLGAIMLFPQVEQLVGNAFVLHGPIKRTQTRPDIGLWTEPVIHPRRLRPHPLLAQKFVLFHAYRNHQCYLVA